MAKFNLNGQSQDIKAADHLPLITILRTHCGLNSPRYGCGQEQCGACVILIDGEQLAELMIEHNVGAATEAVYEVKESVPILVGI